jgi:hypothetical protein
LPIQRRAHGNRSALQSHAWEWWLKGNRVLLVRVVVPASAKVPQKKAPDLGPGLFLDELAPSIERMSALAQKQMCFVNRSGYKPAAGTG